jgi:hypothetical protein
VGWNYREWLGSFSRTACPAQEWLRLSTPPIQLGRSQLFLLLSLTFRTGLQPFIERGLETASKLPERDIERFANQQRPHRALESASDLNHPLDMRFREVPHAQSGCGLVGFFTFANGLDERIVFSSATCLVLCAAEAIGFSTCASGSDVGVWWCRVMLGGRHSHLHGLLDGISYLPSCTSHGA